MASSKLSAATCWVVFKKCFVSLCCKTDGRRDCRSLVQLLFTVWWCGRWGLSSEQDRQSLRWAGALARQLCASGPSHSSGSRCSASHQTRELFPFGAWASFIYCPSIFFSSETFFPWIEVKSLNGKCDFKLFPVTGELLKVYPLVHLFSLYSLSYIL